MICNSQAQFSLICMITHNYNWSSTQGPFKGETRALDMWSMKNGQRWTSTQWTNKETSGWLVWLHYYEWWVFEACWLHHYDQLAMSLPVWWSAENTKSTLEACWLHQHDRLVVSFHRPVVLFHRPVVLHCCRAMQCRESKMIFHEHFESSEISSEPVLKWDIPFLSPHDL